MPSRWIMVFLLVAAAGCTDDRHDERMRAAGPNPSLERLMQVASAPAGEAKFRQCMACHTIIPDALDKEGPNLFGVFGKPFGQNRHGYPYTSALIGAGGRWDAATLNAWIANPKRIVPGTTMQFSGVTDPLDRADLIVFLQSQSAGHATGGAS